MKNVPELRFDGFDGEWEEKKLEDSFNVTMGQSPNSKNYTVDSDSLPLIGGNADIKQGKINPSIFTTQVTKKSYPGNIIMTVRAPVGDLAMNSSEVVIGRGVCSIDGNNYLYYNLEKKKYENYWRRFISGSTFESINSSDIKSVLISFPENYEQEKIGDLFKKLDDLIEIQEAKVSKMEDFKKFMLQKMFPKKGELVPEFRFDGFDNYGFDKGKINDFIVTHGSKNYIKQPADVGTYKVIQQGDIPIAGYSNEDPYKDFSNVILFGDHTLSLFKPYEPFLLSTDGIKIIFIENIDREYFYYLVQHAMPKSQGYKRHYKILRSVKVNIPKSYKEQQKIGQFFKNLDTQIENEERLLESYKMMKKSLLQKMFV